MYCLQIIHPDAASSPLSGFLTHSLTLSKKQSEQGLQFACVTVTISQSVVVTSWPSLTLYIVVNPGPHISENQATTNDVDPAVFWHEPHPENLGFPP